MAYGDKVKFSVLETNGVDNFDGPEERELTADVVDFANAGTTIRNTNVDAILKELRKQVVTVPDAVDEPTGPGTTNQLDTDSHTLQIVHVGTGVTGHICKTPDATTLFDGAIYRVVNAEDSEEEIEVRDYDGNVFATLLPQESLELTLEDNGTTAGHWFVEKKQLTATGILNYNISSDVTFNTDNTTDTLITGMTVSPAPGTYAVWFSSDINIESNNDIVECVIYKNGSPEEKTRRKVQGVSSNFKSSFYTLGTVIVTAGQVVDVRVKSDTKTLTVGGRTLILIRLG